MIKSQSKTHQQSDLEFLYSRLDEIRMSGHERMRARAQLARAEAIADLVVLAIGSGRRLVRALVIRPIRRLATTLG